TPGLQHAGAGLKAHPVPRTKDLSSRGLTAGSRFLSALYRTSRNVTLTSLFVPPDPFSPRMRCQDSAPLLFSSRRRPHEEQVIRLRNEPPGRGTGHFGGTREETNRTVGGGVAVARRRRA